MNNLKRYNGNDKKIEDDTQSTKYFIISLLPNDI